MCVCACVCVRGINPVKKRAIEAKEKQGLPGGKEDATGLGRVAGIRRWNNAYRASIADACTPNGPAERTVHPSIPDSQPCSSLKRVIPKGGIASPSNPAH